MERKNNRFTNLLSTLRNKNKNLEKKENNTTIRTEETPAQQAMGTGEGLWAVISRVFLAKRLAP